MRPARLLVYKDRKGMWRWRLSVSSDIIADSGEGYARRFNAVRAAKGLIAALSRPIVLTVAPPSKARKD